MNQVPDVNPITDSPDTNWSERVLLHSSLQKLEEMENAPVWGSPREGRGLYRIVPKT